MTTRNAPGYPGLEWTRRQREVLDLLAQGYTNPEIAERLGISLDGAKWHVSEVMSKLGVHDREEAGAYWARENRLVVRFGRRFRALTWWGSLRWAVVAGGGAVAVLVAVAIVLLAQGGDDDAPTAPTETATVAPATPEPPGSATPSPTETINGVGVEALALGAGVPFPEDVVLNVESGCTACDGPAAALQRMYRGPDGTLRTEDLFRNAGATLQEPDRDARYITSMALSGGGYDVLLAFCEGPYCGGVGNIAEGARVSIRHSSDGGITWTSERVLEGGAWVLGNLGPAPAVAGGPPGFGILSRTYRPAAGEPWRSEAVFYPSGDPLPAGWEDPGAVSLLDPSNGPLLRPGQDGLTFYHPQGAPSGTPWFDFRALPEGSKVVDLEFAGPGMLVTWTNGGAMYSALTGPMGASMPLDLRRVFRWPDDLRPSFHRPNGAMIGPATLVIGLQSYRNNLPSVTEAIVDFEAGSIRPIAELDERGRLGDRLLVKGAATGPFARVRDTGAGSCLNVREQPTLAANAYACYADGVLLVELGQRREADGRQWMFVQTPEGRQGWASLEFLEPSGRAPSLAYHPAGTRTGVAVLDRVIAALEADQRVPQDLVDWQPVECAAPTGQGIGGPPACPPGVADGTPIDAIAGGACEGYWHVRPADGSPIELVVGPGQRLSAVVTQDPAQRFGEGEYMLIYVDPSAPGFARAIFASDEGITGDWSGCGATPGQLLAEGASIVLAPPPP